MDPQSNPDTKVDEVDNLSTNGDKQMDRENVGMDEEDIHSVTSDDGPVLNEELKTAYKILQDFMLGSKKAVNWPFMESVEVTAPDLYEDYKKRIEKPMWLKLMKSKFEHHQYGSITEFVSDFRLMLENCYRFNGPDHYISKRAQKLETMLEQKLALLPRDVREKTSINATSGGKNEENGSGLSLRRRGKSHLHHDSTVLLSQLREMEQQKVRDYRRQMMQDRKAEKDALVQEIMEWEDKVLWQGRYKQQMKAMWEIPQIGLFLFLCQGPLNIGEVMHFELERAFLLPRESSTMQLVMTTLLSTPFQRLKIDKKALMPYSIWEQKLRVKMQLWYKVLTDAQYDLEKTCTKLGLEEQFFDIVGQKNPMEKKKYHELSYYRQVWIMKGLCDHCLQTQESLRETIELQPFHDQREYLLGTDTDGQTYIHFPQFCGADVRIYRQAPVKYPKLEIKPDPFESKRKFPLVYKPPPAKKIKLKKKKRVKKTDKPSPLASPTRQRPSRLRQTIKNVVPIQQGQTSSSDETSETSDMDTNNDTNTEDDDTACDRDTSDINNDDNDLNTETDTKSDNDRLSSGSDATIPYCDKSDTNSSAISSRDCSRESSPYPTPTDLGLRRSARLDGSREASPLIFDSDFGLRRSSRRLKNIPPLKATRDLTHLLLDENSTSNSSAFGGENSNSAFWKDKLMLNENSKSSDTGEDSNSCDISKLFSSVKNMTENGDLTESSAGGKDTSLTESSSQCKNTSIGECTEAESMDTSESSSKVNQGNVYELASSGKNMCNGNVDEMETQSNEDEDLGGQTKDSSHVHNDIMQSDSKEESAIYTKGEDLNEEMDEDDSEIGTDEQTENNHKNKNFDTISADSKSQKVLANDTGKSKEEEVNGVDDIKEIIHQKNNEELMETIIENDDNSYNQTLTPNKPNHNGQYAENHEEDFQLENEILDQPESLKSEGTIESGVRLKAIDKIKVEPIEHDEISTEDETVATDSTHPEDFSINNNIKHEESCIDDKPDTEMEVKTEAEDIKNEIKTENPEIKREVETPETDVKIEVKKEEGHEDKTVIDIKKEKAESDEEEEEEKIPDPRQFELLADSVEGLRRLAAEFAEQEPIVINRGKREQIMKPPPRKKNVIILHERLEYLLKELEPWESKLQQATKRARIRIRKEVEDYVEPVEQDDKWNTTDEETESGASGDDDDKNDDGDGQNESRKSKSTSSKEKPSTRGTNSRCSTPVKPEEMEEIDVSQRGRLRKRRIIPNNVEDQFATKKMKSLIKTEAMEPESSPSQNQPVIIQSGKSQLVDYADILRQLKGGIPTGSTGASPILIKTTQGGRTVLTSVMPVASAGGTAAVGGVQGLRLIAPASMSSQLLGQSQQQLNLGMAMSSAAATVTKGSQHPTIQNLLSATPVSLSAGIKILPQMSSAGSPLIQILPQSGVKVSSATSMSSNYPLLATVQPSLQPSQPGQGNIRIQTTPRQTTPQKIVLQGQTTPQKIVLDPSKTPKKIAPHTSAGETPSAGKVKYYAANASTLPINVVQQLLATRGAKLQTGPNQQSILYIPMESEGQTRNVVVPGKFSTPVTQPMLSPLKPSTSGNNQILKIDTSASQVTGSQKSPGSAGLGSSTTVTQSNKTLTASTTITPILPKPQTNANTSPVFNINVTHGAGFQEVKPRCLQSLTQACIQQNQIEAKPHSANPLLQSRTVALNISKPYLPPTSPPRYPTNETVRTLLDKRKYGELDDKVYFPPTTYPCIASQLQGGTPKPLTIPTSIPNNHMLRTNVTVGHQKVTIPRMQGITVTVGNDLEKKDKSVAMGTPIQQCVVTSISQAKLNTLLLQTTAAGAKSIPSLIKLPSKAVLDSAVKAVVTSVNTTLPTVNIKVPFPTSLPSLSPRRNVTKTIQTMRSPIPVAPKVVTESSGAKHLSVCDTHAAPTEPINSMTGLASASTPTSITQSQVTAIIQNIDGKNVLTKVAPQTFLTSKGVVQMGYLTPQGMVVPKVQQAGSQSTTGNVLNQTGTKIVKQEPGIVGNANLAGNSALLGMQLVQNSAGQLQLVQKSSPLLQQNTTTLSPSSMQYQLQTNLSRSHNQVQMSSGGPALLQAAQTPTRPASQPRWSNSPSPTAILPKTTSMFTPLRSPGLTVVSTKSPTLTSGTTPIKSAILGANLELKSVPSQNNLIMPQMTGSYAGNPTQAGTINPSTVSPLLNMQQGLLLPGGGIQLAARPVLNQLGVNLLQQGLPGQSPTLTPTSQNLNMLQLNSSLNSAALQQMGNINPLMLNQVSSSNMASPALLQTTNVQGNGQRMAQLSASPLPSQLLGSPMVLNSNFDQNSSKLLTTPTSNNQLVFQYAVPTQNVSSTNAPAQNAAAMQGPSAVKNLNSTFAMVNQASIQRKPVPMIAKMATAPVLSPKLPSFQNQNSLSSAVHTVAMPTQSGVKSPEPSASPKPNVNPSHQKLLLFSIGGQLVTGQGVPVTLSDGVLKLMPRGKIQVANQMLSQEQIQQTLAKINHSAVTGLNVPLTEVSTQQTTHQTPIPSAGIAKPVLAIQTGKSKEPILAIQPGKNKDPILQVQRNIAFLPTATAGLQYPTQQDHAYQHKNKIPKANVNFTAMTSTNSSNTEIAMALQNPNVNANMVSANIQNSNLIQASSETNPTTTMTGAPIYVKPRSNNSNHYVMKPMVYSSGYIVCPRSNVETTPVVKEVTPKTMESKWDKTKFMLDKKEGFIVKAPIKSDVNGQDIYDHGSPNINSSLQMRSLHGENSSVKMEVDEYDDSEPDLIIDDSSTEKEAALNLLTLANQALAPMTTVKIEQNVDNTGDAHTGFNDR